MLPSVCKFFASSRVAFVLNLGPFWVLSRWESSSVGLTAGLNRRLVVFFFLGGSERG